ncbi:secreted RxLR effector protein 161-like [Nicotiana tabacum]|uniref:Secreted RxLR effector protein 161-like n=1 Tax=Nicotiana tabacum TaxID=4097 RepID=A0AC58TE22_TOBAC
MAQIEYASAIGSMMYAMHYTKPDIAFAVCKLTRFTSNPRYSNASWITNVNDSKATSGWIFTLGGDVISWASKKQTCISYSTMESEFIALAAAGKKSEMAEEHVTRH